MTIEAIKEEIRCSLFSKHDLDPIIVDIETYAREVATGFKVWCEDEWPQIKIHQINNVSPSEEQYKLKEKLQAITTDQLFDKYIESLK